MTLIRGINRLNKEHGPCVASIGNYDGVHRGHQHVIKTLLKYSKELGVRSTVITFEPLAKEFFQPNSIERLTTIDERAELLFELGVDQVLCIDFDAEFASYSPADFVEDVLLEGLNVKRLCVGDDFRFGKNRAGDFNLLKDLGSKHGFEVTAHQTFEINGARVSSGRVRQALIDGEFGLAEILLGRAYTVSGVVSLGRQLGRTINYPTANIVLPDMKMPLSGVFAVTAEVAGQKNIKGVANIGTRPTVDGKENRLEVHLFDFSQDIYDQTMRVTFTKKIRDEQKFDSFELLKQQIEKDAQHAQAILSIEA